MEPFLTELLKNAPFSGILVYLILRLMQERRADRESDLRTLDRLGKVIEANTAQCARVEMLLWKAGIGDGKLSHVGEGKRISSTMKGLEGESSVA